MGICVGWRRSSFSWSSFLPPSLALCSSFTLGWLESTKGPHSTATSGCRAAIT
jgi:hypothetical protein